MSRVDDARRLYEGWARGDFQSSASLLDSDTTLVIRPDFPEWGTYVGPEQIGGYMRELLGPFEDFTITAEEFVDAGDTVVVRVHQEGTGAASGVYTEHRYYQVLTFRGEKLVRIESIQRREDALAAAGLG